MSSPNTLTYTRAWKHDHFLCATCGEELPSTDLANHTITHQKALDEALARSAEDDITWTFVS